MDDDIKPEIEPKGAIAWMARNSVAANLLMLLFLVGGLLSAPGIRQEVFPEFELDVVTVTVPYPGASPEEVEQGIVLAVEDAVQSVDGVKRVTSVASEGAGTVTIELIDGTDGNKALQDIGSAVDRITTFPLDAERPTVNLVLARRDILTIVLYGDVDEEVLRALAEQAKDELTQDPGVTLVEIQGVRPLEISIDIPREVLRAHGLTLAQAAEAIARATPEISAGGVKTASGEILLRTKERRDYGNEFLDVPVRVGGDGVRVEVGDVATVRDTFEDIDVALFHNGKRAAQLDIYRVGEENPIGLSKVVNGYVERLRARLPPTVSVDIVNDRSEVYRDRLDLLLRNAGTGLILVMLVLGLFLEVRLAFWVMMGIPTSFLGSLLLLPHYDVSINMISLFAFIIAVGIVVDDAIVVGESVYYQRQRGKSMMPASVKGTRIVAAPVVFSILTNIVAFLPLLFVPGTMGQIWRNIPIVIIAVFSISLVEALFILPAHLAHQRPQPKGGFWRALEWPQRRFGQGLERLVETRYRPFLMRALRHRYLTLALGLSLLVLTYGWLAGGHMGFTFFPKVESDRVRAEATLPHGAPFEAGLALNRRLIDSARQALEPHGGERVFKGISSSVKGKDARVTVYLVPLDQRPVTAARFTEAWRKATGEVPGLESLSFKFTIGPSGGRPIDVELSHTDPVILEQAARRVAEALRDYAGVVEIDDGIARGKPQRDFRVTPAARAMGLTAEELGRQARHAFYGAEVRRQQRGKNEVKIVARLPEEERVTEDDVERLVLRAPNGREIVMKEAADIVYGRAYENIRRVDSRRVLNVTAEVTDEVADVGRILDGLRAGALTELTEQYPGLAWSMEGERRDLRDSMGALKRGFLMALLALFALLAIPFKSYVQALIVLIAVPFGIVGAVVGHLVMGYGLSIISIMGMVALSGVVINDNILLVDTVNERRRSDGMDMEQAVVWAPCRRFRPVLLTSLTTFFGLAPIMFETSVQARFLIPMAISLGFGILFSTTIALLFVPALLLVVEDARRLWRGQAS